MKKNIFMIFTLSSFILLISGCGQTGPLYLPKEKPHTSKHNSN
jgi:predicted small lipoprotein YifL